MPDCSIPSLAPLMATFDAALGPIQPYFDAIFDPGELEEVELGKLTATLLLGPASVPTLQALAFVEVAIAAASLPTMPGLPPVFPPVGISLGGPGIWNPAIQGLALQTLMLAMATVPIELIIKIAIAEDFNFPDIIVDLLPDVPAAEAIAECIAEKLPMFA